MLAIVDYGAGNQTSVARALRHLDIPCKVTGNPDEIASADGIIFPGVGSAGQAMAHLEHTGIARALREAVKGKRPLLGICLGCQILLEESEEGSARTLGLVEGRCRRFEAGLKDGDGALCKVPHMGWNGIKKTRNSCLLAGIPDDAEFYFVHSYYVAPPLALILATTYYGREFCSIYGEDGLWGVQFHIEKSGEPGLRILDNFYTYCQEKKANAL